MTTKTKKYTSVQQLEKEGWVYAGSCDVDAGMIMLGDPCYVTADNRGGSPKLDHVVHDWSKFCGLMSGRRESKDFAEVPHTHGGSGSGVVVHSGYGDGSYPVYVRFTDEGDWGRRVAEARILFIYDGEEEDEE